MKRFMSMAKSLFERDCPYGVNGNHVYMDDFCTLCGDVDPNAKQK